jgi:hypothetical protein
MIDFLGVVPENSFSKLLVDFFLLGLTLFIVIRKKTKPNLIEGFINWLFLFFIAIAIVTYFRGGSSVIDIYKVFRIYFPLLLVIPLMYDINYSHGGFEYYKKLFQIIALCITIMLILISVFHVEFFSSWPRLGYGFQDGDYIPGLKRVYIYSSFTFPIVEFIFLIYSLVLGLKVNRIVFALITSGFLLQGFRSYILGTIVIVAVSIIFYLKKQQGISIFKLLRRNLLIFSLALFVSFSFLGNRIVSGISDFVNVSGTFGARIMLDAFRLKVLSENILFGVGFLHNDAERAKKMGVTSSEELRSARTEKNYDVLQESAIYSLRATDSGYLDLLIQFGFVGFIIFMILYISFYFRLGRELTVQTRAEIKLYLISLRTLLLLFLITLISHGALTNIYGLLPLAFGLAFAQYQLTTHFKGMGENKV